eukprot:5833974-Amphidinium_carterae.1
MGAVKVTRWQFPSLSVTAPGTLLLQRVDCTPAPTPSTFTDRDIGLVAPGARPASDASFSCLLVHAEPCKLSNAP